MKTCGSCGIVAERTFSSRKKMGCDIARIGTFHYLYRVLPIGRVIAMVRVCHRDGVSESSRWCISVIAMKRKVGTVVFTKGNKTF